MPHKVQRKPCLHFSAMRCGKLKQQPGVAGGTFDGGYRWALGEGEDENVRVLDDVTRNRSVED